MLHAIQLHHLDLLVGKVDLDEFLDYAVDYPGKAAQFCPMLAFGLFCTQQQGVATGWTKGLAQFNPRELWAQSRTQPPMALLRGMFNLGYSVSGGGAFKAGETASVGDLLVSFRDNPKLATPFIEMVLL